jgi:hypothetical protein
MNLHKDTGDSLEPCKHMEGMLNRTADGTASKAVRWYALYHASPCVRCGTFLKRVTFLLGELRGLKADDGAGSAIEDLPADRWEAIEAGWAEAESKS